MAAEELLRALNRRKRLTDMAGWYNKEEIGVLLAGASARGAWTFADDLCQAFQPMGQNLRFRVFTYPHHPHLPESPLSPGERSSDRRFPERSGETFEYLFASPLPLWKRMLDILGASFLLFPLIPLLGGVALWIKIVSPGPVFFRQVRIGCSGRPFTLWKFRTMREFADESVHEKHIRRLIQEDKPLTKLDDFKDHRILPLGNAFRRFGIDELPQLFHVLRGQMSLVGPRPDVPYSVQQYSSWQTKRLDAVPGLTGLWQISGKNRTTFKDMVRLDIRYARKRSLWNDLKILLMTVPRIISQNIEKASPKLLE